MIKIGILSISDRASAGKYQDRGIPAVQQWLENTLSCSWQPITEIVSDDFAQVTRALINMIDRQHCALVLTTGGTGPAPRDITPDATLAVSEREIVGFGEEMRRVNLQYVPTAILSRQTAVVRKQSLIINLPGQPKAVGETLDGIFASVPYCLELIGQPQWLATNPKVLTAFRPKSAPPLNITKAKSIVRKKSVKVAKKIRKVAKAKKSRN